MEVKNKYKKPFVFGSATPAKKANWSNSSFWLDFDDDATALSGKIDVVKLAGYKRAIGNFVSIVTGKSDIIVKYNDNDMSYTDGKTVTISSKLKDGKSFDTTVGLALHEGSHCLLTDFGVLTKWISDCHDWNKLKLVKDLTNVIEDRRIDSYIYKNAPGYRGYYEAMYDEYFYSPSITTALVRKLKSQPILSNYMFHIINIANPNRDENALPGLKEIYQLIDLKNISRIKSTKESIEVAESVYEMLMLLVNEPEQEDQDNTNESEPNKSTTNDGSSNGNDNDDDDDDNDDNDDEESTLTPKEARAQRDLAKQEERELKYADKHLENDIQQQKDFMDGKIKKGKVSRSQSKQIDAMTSNDVYIQKVGEVKQDNGNIIRNATVNALVINGINNTILESGLINLHYRAIGSYIRSSNTNAVTSGMQLGVLLGKKLKTRDEERVLRTTRCANGAIDKRLIAELGFGAENVFSQIIHYNVKPVYVHLTIDASGSMYGSKWEKAIKTAVAIAKACSMVNNIHVCIDLRGEVAGNVCTPLTWVVYDSQKNNMNHILTHFPNLDATSSTPESLCYESIRKQVIKNANGKDSYLITFSDGEPSFYSHGYHYNGRAAQEHCKNQINEFKKNNIHVLAYFVSDSLYASTYYDRSFKYMYGDSSNYIDTTQLNALSRSINGMFERKQNAQV